MSRVLPKIRAKVLIRDSNKCVLCQSRKNLTIDHIKEVSRGGNDSLGNLRTLCSKCHQAKNKNRKKLSTISKDNLEIISLQTSAIRYGIAKSIEESYKLVLSL